MKLVLSGQCDNLSTRNIERLGWKGGTWNNEQPGPAECGAEVPSGEINEECIRSFLSFFRKEWNIRKSDEVKEIVSNLAKSIFSKIA